MDKAGVVLSVVLLGIAGYLVYKYYQGENEQKPGIYITDISIR